MSSQNDTWKVQNDPPPNPSRGDHLNGLHLKKTATGYEIKVPGANGPLATTNVSEAPFDLTIQYDGNTWNLHVHVLPQGNDGSGKWQILALTEDPNDGAFTAQAGSGAKGDEGEATSSAYA